MSDDDVSARKTLGTDRDAAGKAKAPGGMKDDDNGKGAGILKSAGKAAAAGRVQQLDPAAQAHIGKQLKAIYDGVVNQPVPDRFLELLKQIENAPAKPRKDLQ